MRCGNEHVQIPGWPCHRDPGHLGKHAAYVPLQGVYFLREWEPCGHAEFVYTDKHDNMDGPCCCGAWHQGSFP